MTDVKPEPTVPLATIWPPAPLHNATPPPLFISADGIKVTQSGGNLIIVNKFIHWSFAVQMCVFSLSYLSPFCSYWALPSHHATWRAMLPGVFTIYKQIYWVELLILFISAMFYWSFVAGLNLNGVVMDKAGKTIKANGRVSSLSKIKAVRITQGPGGLLGRKFTLRLVWNGEKSIPWWQKSLTNSEANTSFLGALKQESNAEKIAEAIAEFAGVPVQHRTMAKNSV